MQSNEYKKLIKFVSQLPIYRRFYLLQNIGKNRYNVYFPENISPSSKTNELYNHEFELIALLSVVTDNNINYSAFISENKWLYNMASIIRKQEYLSALYPSYGATGAIAGLLFMQMQGQKNYSNLYYRYNYIYNFVNDKINMPEIFLEKFNTNFISFMYFCILSAIYKEIPNVGDLNWFYSKINDDMKLVFDHLKENRLEFQKRFNNITSNDDIFSFFDLNLLLQYPFIEYEGKFYCPWFPYIPYAATENLMFKITKDNDNLRSLIGKNVLESYVFHLFNICRYSSTLEIHQELVYEKEHHHTSDLILNKSGEVLLIEIKFINQSLKLREMDKNALEYYTQRLAEGIVQLKKNIILFNSGKFNDQMKSNCIESKGVLLTYEGYFFNREDIYKKALEILKDDGILSVIDELKSQIIIMSLYNLENILMNIDDDFVTYTYNLFKQPGTWLDYQYNYDQYDQDVEGMPEIKDYLDTLLTSLYDNLDNLIDLR